MRSTPSAYSRRRSGLLGPSAEHSRLCARVTVLEETQLLTVGEVALRLRQSERTVRDKVSTGLIPSVRIGDGPRAPIRIPADELEEWLYGERRERPADGLEEEA
jgi:excisionase family DNA binding protein